MSASSFMSPDLSRPASLSARVVSRTLGEYQGTVQFPNMYVATDTWTTTTAFANAPGITAESVIIITDMSAVPVGTWSVVIDPAGANGTGLPGTFTITSTASEGTATYSWLVLG